MLTKKLNALLAVCLGVCVEAAVGSNVRVTTTSHCITRTVRNIVRAINDCGADYERNEDGVNESVRIYEQQSRCHITPAVNATYSHQLSAALRHYVRQLHEVRCLEDRLPKVGWHTHRKSLNSRHVLHTIRDKLLCLRVMLVDHPVDSEELWSLFDCGSCRCEACNEPITDTEVVGRIGHTLRRIRALTGQLNHHGTRHWFSHAGAFCRSSWGTFCSSRCRIL